MIRIGKKARSVSGTALVCSTKLPQLRIREVKIIKVASASLSHFEANADLFRLFMKGQFDGYLLSTVAIDELLCLKNAGAQISMLFTSNE